MELNDKQAQYLALMNELHKHLTDFDSTGEEVEYISIKRNQDTDDLVRKVCELTGQNFESYLQDFAEGGEADEIDIQGLWDSNIVNMLFNSERGFFIKEESKKDNLRFAKVTGGEVYPFLKDLRLFGLVDGDTFRLYGCHVDDEKAFYKGIYDLDQSDPVIGFESLEEVENYWVNQGGDMILVIEEFEVIEEEQDEAND